ncbi:hypothetical protein K7W42_22030 [Deinococcus sp. HMF7604]|uniref:hypothetical protein n=1 Tax=Deinococcus betulae TaxID=2873312 RepID=UPI001CCF0AE5|nr:hypothetical protein [Deinococcus betulae]MBZ9753514.1 hypothetical protein [Deinococcus betulae]
MRWIPVVLTGLYYILAAFYPAPALRTLVLGDEYPLSEVLRGGTATLALVVSLYLRARLLKERA